MSVFVHDFDEHTAIVTDFHHLGVEEQFPLVVVDRTFLSQSEIVFFSELLRCFVLRCRRNRGACISPCLVVLTRIVLRCRRNRDTCISPCLVVLTRIPADTGGSAREGQHGRVSMVLTRGLSC